MRPAYAVRPFFYVFRHAEATLQDRPARARHRSPPRRPLARDFRRDGLEPRRRGRVPAGRVRQGLLRRAHRGRAGLALPRARVPHPGAQAGGEVPEELEPALPQAGEGYDARVGSSPARLVIALSVASVLAIFVVYTAVAGNGVANLKPSTIAGHTG